MKSGTSPHPDWATRHRRPGTELRCINGRYYLYSYKTVYDEALKRPKKISGSILGSITEEGGFKESDKGRLRAAKADSPIVVGPVREFGVSQFFLSRFGEFFGHLAAAFPDDWRELVLAAYCRLLYQPPIKNMPALIGESWLCENWQGSSLTDKGIGLLLRRVGVQRENAVAYMRAFIHEGDYFLADTTHVLSKSRLIELSGKGYNNKGDHDPQINSMYVFSTQSRMPVFYRLHAGNIREIKAFGLTLKECGLDGGVVIADKGFYSAANVAMMRGEKLRYIIPLRRNNLLLDYSALKANTFKAGANRFEHEKRFIWYRDEKIDGDRAILFLDDALRVREEADYLRRIKSHPATYSEEKFLERKDRFGTIGLITNVADKTPEEIYLGYKSRMAIEELFDSMKNVLETDNTYMQNEDSLQGLMFVNHLALQFYQQIYLFLKDNKLNGKYAVKDFLMYLKQVRKVRINGQWHDAEITAAVAKMMAIATKT
jgi:hypothetical protein